MIRENPRVCLPMNVWNKVLALFLPPHDEMRRSAIKKIRKLEKEKIMLVEKQSKYCERKTELLGGTGNGGTLA